MSKNRGYVDKTRNNTVYWAVLGIDILGAFLSILFFSNTAGLIGATILFFMLLHMGVVKIIASATLYITDLEKILDPSVLFTAGSGTYAAVAALASFSLIALALLAILFAAIISVLLALLNFVPLPTITYLLKK